MVEEATRIWPGCEPGHARYDARLQAPWLPTPELLPPGTRQRLVAANNQRPEVGCRCHVMEILTVVGFAVRIPARPMRATTLAARDLQELMRVTTRHLDFCITAVSQPQITQDG